MPRSGGYRGSSSGEFLSYSPINVVFGINLALKGINMWTSKEAKAYAKEYRKQYKANNSIGMIQARINKRMRMATHIETALWSTRQDGALTDREAKYVFRAAIAWRNRYQHGQNYDGFWSELEYGRIWHSPCKVYTQDEVNLFAQTYVAR